jgi:hypothetical protein
MDVMQPRQVMANDVAAGNLIQQGRILALHGVPPGVSFRAAEGIRWDRSRGALKAASIM